MPMVCGDVRTICPQAAGLALARPAASGFSGRASGQFFGCSPLALMKRIWHERVMQFSPQQDEALKAVSRWLKDGRKPLFRLFGYAGTGKTTLARHFAEDVGGEVQFAAFTGKAA